MHLQKRPMKFNAGLERERSFMIFPTEFVRDHELTNNEIQKLLTPDPEWERDRQKRMGPGLKGIIKRFFLNYDNRRRIITFKKVYNMIHGSKHKGYW